jgi:hypothetical protein
MELELPLAVGAVATGVTLASLLALILGVSACASLFRNAALSGSAKAMWLLIILFFPIFGSMIYFGVRSSW